ncbi:DUF1684 domain-containing protein [Azonexus sp.]|uniref:DUF1684 domain-containing protein n=1 Tax=Azonexus sp. TaxID=1872668 RepID=UPI0035ADD799
MSQDSFEDWRQRRHAELAGPDSWFGLVGLFWLEDEVSRVGSAADCVVRLPAGPAHLGDLLMRDGSVVWRPVNGAGRHLATDRDGKPDVVNHELLSFFIVERDGKLAARVRDRGWAQQRLFHGLEHFSEDPAWIVEADWLPLDPPLILEVPNVSGDLKPVTVGFQARFEIAGQTLQLLPMSVGDSEVFFVFRDRTSARETYGGGRFLKVKPAADGRIRLDFNRAFNPPCAFTPFATCPLPPPENWLPLAVTAGEKRWNGAH